MQPGIDASTHTVTGIGTTTPSPVIAPASGVYGGTTPNMQPSIMAFVSGTVTYNIEVTGDDVSAPGYNAEAGNWQPMSSALTGLTADTVATLGAAAGGVRGRITSGTGKLTLQFCQFTGAP